MSPPSVVSASPDLRLIAAAPNFISDIFFLTVAAGHYGVQQTFNRFEEALKQYHEMKEHLQMLQGDGSWMGVRALFTGCVIITLTRFLYFL